MLSAMFIDSMYSNFLTTFEAQPIQIAQGGQLTSSSNEEPHITCVLTKDTLRIGDHVYAYNVEASMGFLNVGVSIEVLSYEEEQHLAIIRAGMITHSFRLPASINVKYLEKIASLFTQLMSGEELVELHEGIVHLQFKKIS